MRRLPWLCGALVLVACDQRDSHSHTHPHPHAPSGVPAAATSTQDEPETAELRIPLGRLQIGATLFEVVQIEMIEPGSYFEVFADAIEGPKPLATRIWLGDESGVGSRKGLVHFEADGPHAHVDIREDYDKDRHRIWIEVERLDRSRERASIQQRD